MDPLGFPNRLQQFCLSRKSFLALLQGLGAEALLPKSELSSQSDGDLAFFSSSSLL